MNVKLLLGMTKKVNIFITQHWVLCFEFKLSACPTSPAPLLGLLRWSWEQEMCCCFFTGEHPSAYLPGPRLGRSSVISRELESDSRYYSFPVCQWLRHSDVIEVLANLRLIGSLGWTVKHWNLNYVTNYFHVEKCMYTLNFDMTVWLSSDALAGNKQITFALLIFFNVCGQIKKYWIPLIQFCKQHFKSIHVPETIWTLWEMNSHKLYSFEILQTLRTWNFNFLWPLLILCKKVNWCFIEIWASSDIHMEYVYLNNNIIV